MVAVRVKLLLCLRMVAGTRAKRTLKIPRFGYKGFFPCGINSPHIIFSNLNLFWNKYFWTFSLEWKVFRHPFIQHTADIFKPLCWRIYIRYHFIFQALQVFFYENTCHALYLIFFYLLRIFLNIWCENLLCFISYLLWTFLKPFLGEYSSPIRFFFCYSKCSNISLWKIRTTFFISETRTFSVKFISHGLYFLGHLRIHVGTFFPVLAITLSLIVDYYYYYYYSVFRLEFVYLLICLLGLFLFLWICLATVHFLYLYFLLQFACTFCCNFCCASNN